MVGGWDLFFALILFPASVWYPFLPPENEIKNLSSSLPLPLLLSLPVLQPSLWTDIRMVGWWLFQPYSDNNGHVWRALIITGQNLWALCALQRLFLLHLSRLHGCRKHSEWPDYSQKRDPWSEKEKWYRNIHYSAFVHFYKASPDTAPSATASHADVFEYSQMNQTFSSPSDLYPSRHDAYPLGVSIVASVPYVFQHTCPPLCLRWVPSGYPLSFRLPKTRLWCEWVSEQDTPVVRVLDASLGTEG